MFIMSSDYAEVEISKKSDTKRDDEASASGYELLDVETLCKEFYSLYAQDLVAVSKPLDELTRNQDVLLETMQQENDRFVQIGDALPLQEMFSKISEYQAKLLCIKKDMVALHDKVVKLKKRAFHVQQIKEKQRILAQRK